MVLRTVGPDTRESALQHAQTADSIDVELLPSVGRTTLTLAADLKSEQALDTMPDAVVMGLDDADTSAFVNELDETLVNDRAYEIAVHRFINVAADQRVGGSLNGLKTFKPGRRKSCSFPVAIVSPYRRAVAAM